MKSEFYLGAKRMTIEQQLIEKMFYETFMIDNPEKEPIQVLGEAYLEEQKKDLPDLSAIRFAQGELYFHFKDYESAIFKWENIQNEWGQWAKKNTADAYFELGLLPTAEDIYKSIATEDLTLHTEVSLQLFSLYMEQNKQELASNVIKEVILNRTLIIQSAEISSFIFTRKIKTGLVLLNLLGKRPFVLNL